MRWKTFGTALATAGTVATGGTFAADATINPYEVTAEKYELASISTVEAAGENKIEAHRDRPAVTLSKWNGEAAMTIAYGDVNAEGSRQFLTDRVEWKGDTEELHAYPLPAAEGMEDGGFEIEVYLRERPASNIFRFAIEGAEELDFFYQPELTPEEIEEGAVRPENVIGSYAVYHKTKANHRVGDTNYATGKIFHIYRPKAIDADGVEVWAKLFYSDGVLSVTVPEKWLETAVYPVRVDPTFGSGAVGATAPTCDNFLIGNIYSLPVPGSVTSMSVYLSTTEEFEVGDTISIGQGLYNSSDALLGNSTVASVGSTHGQAFLTQNVSASSLSAANYLLAVTCSDTASTDQVTWRFDAGTAGQDEQAVGYVGASWPSTWTGSPTALARRYSIYATYTPDPSAFPLSDAPNLTTFAATVTSMPVNLPPSIVSGELLLAFVEVRNSGTWTTPTGWNEIGAQLGGASVGELTVFYKIADGSEGATATWTASAGTTATWQVRRITNWHGTTPPEISAGAQGDSSDANSASLSPSWGADNTLWVSAAGHAAASAAAWSAGPASYTDFLNTGASSGGAAASLATAVYPNNASSEDPGAFTVSGSNRWWAAFTVAVRPIDGGGDPAPAPAPDSGVIWFE